VVKFLVITAALVYCWVCQWKSV